MGTLAYSWNHWSWVETLRRSSALARKEDLLRELDMFRKKLQPASTAARSLTRKPEQPQPGQPGQQTHTCPQTGSMERAAVRNSVTTTPSKREKRASVTSQGMQMHQSRAATAGVKTAGAGVSVTLPGGNAFNPLETCHGIETPPSEYLIHYEPHDLAALPGYRPRCHDNRHSVPDNRHSVPDNRDLLRSSTRLIPQHRVVGGHHDYQNVPETRQRLVTMGTAHNRPLSQSTPFKGQRNKVKVGVTQPRGADSGIDMRNSFRSHTSDVRSHTSDVRSHTSDVRSHTSDVRSHTSDVRSHTSDVRSHTSDVRSHTSDVRSHTSETRSQPPDHPPHHVTRRTVSPDLDPRPTSHLGFRSPGDVTLTARTRSMEQLFPAAAGGHVGLSLPREGHVLREGYVTRESHVLGHVTRPRSLTHGELVDILTRQRDARRACAAHNDSSILSDIQQLELEDEEPRDLHPGQSQVVKVDLEDSDSSEHDYENVQPFARVEPPGEQPEHNDSVISSAGSEVRGSGVSSAGSDKRREEDALSMISYTSEEVANIMSNADGMAESAQAYMDAFQKPGGAYCISKSVAKTTSTYTYSPSHKIDHSRRLYGSKARRVDELRLQDAVTSQPAAVTSQSTPDGKVRHLQHFIDQSMDSFLCEPPPAVDPSSAGEAAPQRSLDSPVGGDTALRKVDSPIKPIHLRQSARLGSQDVTGLRDVTPRDQGAQHLFQLCGGGAAVRLVSVVLHKNAVKAALKVTVKTSSELLPSLGTNVPDVVQHGYVQDGDCSFFVLQNNAQQWGANRPWSLIEGAVIVEAEGTPSAHLSAAHLQHLSSCRERLCLVVAILNCSDDVTTQTRRAQEEQTRSHESRHSNSSSVLDNNNSVPSNSGVTPTRGVQFLMEKFAQLELQLENKSRLIDTLQNQVHDLTTGGVQFNSYIEEII